MTAAREIFRICQADNFGGTLWCGRCRMHWDAGAQGDDIPHCKPKADPPIGLTEMIAALEEHVRDEMTSQVVLVRSGLRAEPWGPALRKTAVFRAVAVVLDQIRDDTDAMKRLRDA
jgi:hypothetical protein